MPLDPEYLRQHYALLNDEALLAVDRAELVEIARMIFDEEVGRRELPQLRDARRRHEPHSIPGQTDPPDVDAELDYEITGAGDKPSWLDEAAEVYSRVVFTRTAPAPDAANARDVLEEAGVPCYLELCEVSPEKNTSPEPTHRWRLMVPGELNLRATSILERDIINAEFEAEWKTHLEALSDKELRAMSPQVAFCGLFDRIERVNRIYDQEITRRRLLKQE